VNANHQLRFTLATPQSGAFQIRLFTIVGQSIQQQQIFLQKGEHQLKIDLPAHYSGIGVLAISDGKHQQVIKDLW
jgi:hypothetical protein